MRAIIIAAGAGTRLRPFTDDRPKCMVEVGGRPILHHQLDALRAHGVDDIVVVRGYHGGRIEAPGVRFVENRGYQHNNILESLFCADRYLYGDLIVSYADIVYRPQVVGALMACMAPIALIVDRRWAKAYDGRTDHPVDQAELCRVHEEDGWVVEVGKQVPPEGALGEFIGLARFSAAAIARLWAIYLSTRSQGEDPPIGAARSMSAAYLTDLINAAIAHDQIVAPVPIDGGWREIDTVQDLRRADEIVASWVALSEQPTLEFEP